MAKWGWDYRTQRYIEVPGFNIHVECKCGRKFVTAEDTERCCCGEPIPK